MRISAGSFWTFQFSSRELQRCFRVVEQMQGEPSLFPYVHPVTAQAAGFEAVSQLFHLSRQFLRVLCLQCQGVAQQ